MLTAPAWRPRPLGLTTAALLAVFATAPPAPTAQVHKQVLALYGTRVDAQIAVVGARELPRIIAQALEEGLDYYTEYLDVARFPGEDYQVAVRDFLRRKYGDHQFDLVIAMDDVALQFVDTHRRELFPDAPLVFASTDPGTSRLPNSTGILAPMDLGGTLTLAARLQPGVRRVVVVTGADRRDAAAEQVARAQFQAFEPEYAFTYLSGLPTSELERRLSALPPDAIVYYVLANRDGQGQAYHPLDYLDIVTAAASVPVYSWVDSAMGHGIVGGALKNQMRQMAAIGELTLRVLRGEPADSIATMSPDLAVAQVDWRQLKRWGISEARVPDGVQMLFREPSIWDHYRVYIVAAVVLMLAQSALIGMMVVQGRRRRLAEAQVLGSRAEINRSHDRIRDLAGRLLRAQDSERARIASELHDDVGQQLALLSSDLELLSGLSEGESSDVADEALMRVRTVSRSVHDLSHRLHPARLQLIGLVPSLESLPQEFSKRGLGFTLTHEGVPASLPTDLALSLFRIAQEAVRNAAKHSGARNVSVSLCGRAGELTLVVVDDGVGFDPQQAAGRGLGLASMRERIDAVGGSFDIQSGPAGTRVRVIVPVRQSGTAQAVTA